MAIKDEEMFTWGFDEIALNLAKSARHLKPDEATIVQDIDFDDSRGAVVGRYGTKTLNVAANGTPDPLAIYPMYDLFRATDTDPSPDRKYIVGVYDDGVNYKLGALCTSTGEKAFTTLAAAGPTAFNLTRGERVSFANLREPNLNDVVVMGTNGVDKPFYFKGNGVVTEFQFGAVSNFKLKYLLERPWKGRMFAALRSGEETTIHWSETTNFLSWVETEGSGFRQCPQDDLLNAFRGMRIFGNQLTVFNLDSIGTLSYTNSSADPFRFSDITRGHGALSDRAIAVAGDGIWFLDKRAPYLKRWNGYNVTDNYKSADTIATGFEKWLDLSDALNVRMTATKEKLFISFKARPTYASVGTDGQRWLAVVSLNKLDRNNLPYHPMSLWKIRTNDIIHVDEGTDFGQVYYTDAATQTIGGTPYYFLRRICDWYDTISSEANAMGDRNGITGTAATNIANVLQTGWLTMPGDVWFEALYASVDASWQGTPSTNTTFNVKYRFEGWSSFQTLVVTAVNGLVRYPFPGNAQGRKMQLRFEYTDNASRPILDALHLWLKAKPGVRR